MHKLSREVRFCVNPFLGEVSEGFNSYGSKPCGEGLALYFGLWVELAGLIDTDSGFVVNVTQIDRAVRKFVVPVFCECIGKRFGRAEHVGFSVLFELLKRAWSELCDKFGGNKLVKLCLEVNPFRKISIDSEDCEMVYFGEKFEFAAMHKLWNDKFSEQENFEVFGKCANPAGHGHNYVIEVSVKADVVEDGFGIGKFEKIVEDEFIRIVDHKNLNVDLAEFSEKNPTVENITAFAWEKLLGKFKEVGNCELYSITVWENDRTYCTYYG